MNRFARKSKYGNKKITIDNIIFDSKKEAKRYQELKLLERANEINQLKLQPKFQLQPSFKMNGKTIREINYIADFTYIDKKGNIVVEDVKGYETDIYKMKSKMFAYKYGFEITEI